MGPDGVTGAAVILLGLLGIWLWLSMLAGPWHVFEGLTRAQNDIVKAKQAVSAGSLKDARYYTYDASASVTEARDGLGGGGPLFDLVKIWPRATGTLDQLPHVVDAADFSARAAAGTLDIAQNALKGRNKIIKSDPEQAGGSVIDLERVGQVGEEIVQIRTDLVRARSALQAVDRVKVVHTLRKKVTKGIAQADDAIALLDKAHAGFRLLPGILGGNGPRTYILAFQNSAEERGTGGAMLQFAVMTFDNGAPHMKRKTATVYQVDKNRQPLTIGLPADAWYVKGITDAQRFGNSNWSPDWPLSVKLMIDYGQASTVTGFPNHVDGMIGVDPTAAEQMMKGVGAFNSPKAHVRVTKDDLVNFLLFKAYASYPVTAVRRVVLHDVVKGFYQGMFDPKHPSDMVKGLGKALVQKHVQVWMARPREEAYVKKMHWDGSIERGHKGDYSSIVEQNVGGNKLDYFETRDYSLDIHFRGRDALDTSKASIFNGVTMPQPRWSMGDSGPFHHPMLNFYAPQSARLMSFSGPSLSTSGDPVARPSRIGSPPNLTWTSGSPPEHHELGTNVWSGTLDIPPSQTGSMQMRYVVPGAVETSNGRSTYRLALDQQPGVHPVHQTVTVHIPATTHDVSAPGFRRAGDILVWDHVLDSDTTLTVSWKTGT